MTEERCCSRSLLIAAGVLGFLLVVFGIVLIGLGVPGFVYVKIGTIVAGVLLLLLVGAFKFLRSQRILCYALVLVTLFLIIAGIIALTNIIGYILIGLGVIALILAVLCLGKD